MNAHHMSGLHLLSQLEIPCLSYASAAADVTIVTSSSACLFTMCCEFADIHCTLEVGACLQVKQLIEGADAIGAVLVNRHQGFLPNKRQLRMGGLAALEMAQTLRQLVGFFLV